MNDMTTTFDISFTGWVVRKLLEQLACSPCKEALVSDKAVQSDRYRDSLTLLTVKNCGKLVFPSDGVISILMSTERHLRQTTGLKLSTACSQLHLERCVLTDVGPAALGLEHHAKETSHGVDNHYFDVVRLLVRTYTNLRFHHIVRLHNTELQGKRLRQKYNKLVLFKGQ